MILSTFSCSRVREREFSDHLTGCGTRGVLSQIRRLPAANGKSCDHSLTRNSGLTDFTVSTTMSVAIEAISLRNSLAAETSAAFGSDALATEGSTFATSSPAPFFLTTSLALRTMASKR